ncbi:Acetolactate synthase, mitochondrial [Blastosporella zonata]|nr:Acetolactate synthase, mitochondrial [Blastosporella zonata]
MERVTVYERRYFHTPVTNPDFFLLANAMGVHAIRCHTAEELPAKMKEFLEYDGNRSVVMECLVTSNEHVFPMVVAGKALHEQMLHPSLKIKAREP